MIDLVKIASTTDKYNFHSHTQFCDGRATMEEFVREAIALGYSHYGFSPHCPVKIESSCNMSQDRVEEYLNEVTRLQQAYGNKINLYASMEIDFFDDFGPSHPYFQDLALDYRIGSVHFIPSFDDNSKYIDIDGRFSNFEKKMSEFFHDDIEEVVKSYFRQSMKMIEQGGFDIIAHCDKIGLNASYYRNGITEENWYQLLLKRHFEAILDHRYRIEINTKAWEQQNRLFPHSKFFSMLKKHNVPVLCKLINTGLQLFSPTENHLIATAIANAILASSLPAAAAAGFFFGASCGRIESKRAMPFIDTLVITIKTDKKM